MALNLTSAVGAGLGSGIDINGVIEQLLAMQRQPIVRIQQRQDAIKSEISAITSVRNKIDAIRTSANGISDLTAFAKWSASSSLDTVATVKATGSAGVGSLAFRVTQMATSHSMRSNATSTDLAAAAGATTASSIAVARGLGSLGIGTLKSNGVAEGALDVSVTRASQAATRTSVGLGALTTIDASNDTLSFEANGALKTVAVAHGTYDRAGLQLALKTAFHTAGVDGDVAVTLGGSNQLQISTIGEGSAATLRIAGGTAASTLGFSVDAVATTGVDGALSVGGQNVTVADARAGGTVSLAVGGGTMDVTFSGGLRAGTGSGKVVSAGTGSVSDVVAAINGANVGVKAQTVKVGTDSYRLQLSSDGTGATKRLNVDASVFDNLAGMIDAQSGSNAELTIGSGAGEYTVESSTGVFDGVISGWQITAKSVSTQEVTATVTRDTAAVADRVEAFVKSVNDALGDIKAKSKFTAATSSSAGSSGPLAGDVTVRSIASQLLGAFSGSATQSRIPGVSINRQGTIDFDKEKFQTAYDADPTAVGALVTRSATATDTGVRYESARTETKAGTYAVALTQAATKATTAVAFISGAANDARIQIRKGTTTVSYDVLSGQSATSIVSGLNDALRAGGLSVRATATGGGLQLAADSWGSAGSFDVNWDALGAGTFSTSSGLDAAGTIDGVVANGTGRYLALATDAASNAKGLRVEVAGDTTGSRGTVTFSPGVAATLGQLTSSLMTANTGSLALAESGRQTRIGTFEKQIAAIENRVTLRETMLRRQYSGLDSTLGQLKGQSNWMTQQINAMSNSNK